METIKNENKNSKLVFDMRICRKLIHAGYKVIDCKPLKTDKTKTVLVFENTPEFEAALSNIMNEYKEKRTPKIDNKLEVEVADD